MRAYRADLAGLFDHLGRLRIPRLADVDRRALRSWLAKQQSLGQARATTQRRVAAARVFFAWAQQTGLVDEQPGDRPALAQADPQPAADPGPGRRRRHAGRGAGGRRRGRRAGGRPRRRDARAALRHRDAGLGAVRSRPRRPRPRPPGGPGLRQGPQGADRARSAGRPGGPWTPGSRTGRAALVDRGVRPRGVRRRTRRAGSTRGWCAGSCTARCGSSTAPPTSGRTGCGTRWPPTCWRAGPTCAACRRCSATPRWPPRRSTPTSPTTGCARAFEQAHPRA